MARRRIYTKGFFNMTLAHTDADIEATAKAACETFGIIKAGVDLGDWTDCWSSTEKGALFAGRCIEGL